MPKPSTVPTWATDVAAYKSEPGAPKRALGWLAGEKPAADWWNKIWNEIGSWLTWLNGLQDEALTWTDIQTFSGGVDVSTITPTGSLLEVSGTISAVDGGDVQTVTGDLVALAGGVAVTADVQTSGGNLRANAGGAVVSPSGGYQFTTPITRYAFCHASEMSFDSNVGVYRDSGSGLLADQLLTATNAAGVISGRVRVPRGATITAFEVLACNQQIAAADLSLFLVTKCDLPVVTGAAQYGALTQTALNLTAFGETVSIPGGSATYNWAFRNVPLVASPGSISDQGYLAFRFQTPAIADAAMVQLVRVTYTLPKLDQAS